MSGALSIFDKPNSYIGRSVPRPDASRLLAGRGRFVDDLQLPRMVHAAFVRSPYAHARIISVDANQARDLAGVVAVYTGHDLAEHVTPWVGVLTHLQGLRSPPQLPLATDVARWQGEPVVMIVAQSRAIAEDACGLVEIDFEPLPEACNMEAALSDDAVVIHPDLGNNLAWDRTVDSGDVETAFARTDVTIVEREFRFNRHTGVTLEPRSSLVDYNPADESMTYWYSGQAPHMMQALLAKHLGLREENVRLIAGDVGGSFGIKIHTYGDDIATAAVAKLLARPVKFIADRNESFVTDIHARDHRVRGRIAVEKDGGIAALEIDDLTGIGPYSMYPRTSAIECNQVLNLTGAPYQIENYRARGQVVFQNKNMMCQYRAVGHPVAMAVADGLLEDAARIIGLGPVDIRRRNLLRDNSYPVVSPAGMTFDDLSHQKALDKLVEVMDYDTLCAKRDALRKKGVYQGIGFVSMVEVTNPSPMFYGTGGAAIAAQDGATIRLDAAGALHVSVSVTE